MLAYQDFESVKQRWGISQTAILLVDGVVFGDVSINTSAQEDLLDTAREGVTQVLHRVYHHASIDVRP